MCKRDDKCMQYCIVYTEQQQQEQQQSSTELLWEVNRNSYAIYQMALFLMTLNDP